MKTEKRCDNCMYCKESRIKDMIICAKSIRFVKKYGKVKFALHRYDDVCRAWGAEIKDYRKGGKQE